MKEEKKPFSEAERGRKFDQIQFPCSPDLTSCYTQTCGIGRLGGDGSATSHSFQLLGRTLRFVWTSSDISKGVVGSYRPNDGSRDPQSWLPSPTHIACSQTMTLDEAGKTRAPVSLLYRSSLITMASARIIAPKMASLMGQTAVKAARPVLRSSIKPQISQRAFSGKQLQLSSFSHVTFLVYFMRTEYQS
jgi:hypothetical protein